MLYRLLVLVCVCCYVDVAMGDEVRVVRESLSFPIPSQRVAELAAAQLKLFPLYDKDVKRFGHPQFNRAYVSTIIGAKGQQYVFVGFPIRTDMDSSYTIIFQYCAKLPSYEVAEGGLTSGSLRYHYESFVSANGLELIQLEDICYKLYSDQ